MVAEPKTLQEAVIFYSDPDNCLNFLMARRPEWKDGVVCPVCGSKDVAFLKSRRLWQCKTRHPKAQFSIKVGTIFEDSPIGLDKWLVAMWMVANCKNGISSWELHRALGVSQKAAWFMLHRIRLAMQDDLTGGMLNGEIEVDESFIGGKMRNMHKDRKNRIQKEGRRAGKSVVLGMLERDGHIRASVVPDRTTPVIQEHIQGNVDIGAVIFSDEHGGNWRMDDKYTHQIINHAEKYVEGNIHTNGLENFWSLLKRGLHGTYVCVEPFHLFRYIDEQAFRFNHRVGMNDSDRFIALASRVVGKRLTFAEVTGKVKETSPN